MTSKCPMTASGEHDWLPIKHMNGRPTAVRCLQCNKEEPIGNKEDK
ncbi:hypothetical protein SP15_102 [Bacillus phage SP-15]|uniref:Uncharacterized protein n=1 Tax=Bacillus phage SP-15 TaxID=1792032 RepID=A0A127AYS9_9CAUD|nr:hypothetical protein SP15_102 [Bacillus phage SP-15]AMM44901.1 hypothetical protein SP15_102 [Bacillus phage SP-15]